ncbi:hypothetical protein K466DRAFT_606472 [Polyporus arcularius HHB13444]|uniref:Uncharacterized protein n=1 Tax=Polyporus arcularius HHB13444 TaxID=1314778 RepID=A0A5C3NP08_9APHY|nr:hypothetical protein K466DRAFT_606472 [Polyporus arcularius HHB13444]
MPQRLHETPDVSRAFSRVGTVWVSVNDEKSKKEDPDAPFNNQKYLRDTLYTTLNNFSGLNWDQFGVVGFQLLYAYRDRDNEMHYDQLTAGSFEEHDEFMLDEAPFEDWAGEHLPMNSDRAKTHDRERPRLPAWDDDWNRTQLCDVLKTFFSTAWGNTGMPLDYAQLKRSPVTYIPPTWLDAGIDKVEDAKFGTLQVLYDRICDSHDTEDHFRMLAPHPADDDGGTSTPSASTPADRTVVHHSPPKRRRDLHSSSQDEEDVLDTTPKQFPPPSRRAPSPEVDGTTLHGSVPPPLDSPTIATLEMAIQEDLVTTETEPEIDQLLPSDTGIGHPPQDDHIEDATTTAHIVANMRQDSQPEAPAGGQGDDNADKSAEHNADKQAEVDSEAGDSHTSISAVELAPRQSSRKRQGEALEPASTTTTTSKRRRTKAAAAEPEGLSTTSRTTRSQAAASAPVPAIRVTRARAKNTRGGCPKR